MSRLRTLVLLPLSLPAVVTAGFFGMVAWLLAVGAWWTILFTGRMPRTIHEMQGLTYAFQCHTLAYVPLLLTDAYPWYETGPLALRRPPETRNPEAGLPPTEGPAPGDRVSEDGQPGGFLPPPPQSISPYGCASDSRLACSRLRRFSSCWTGDERSNRPTSSDGDCGCVPVAIRSAAMPPQRWPSTLPTPL